MGRIFEALRPYMSDFCDMVDPAELMCQLPQLRPCDWVGLHVMFVLCGIYLLQYIIASLCCSYFHWATFVKRFALCCRTVVCLVCLSCLSCPVSKVGVLWQNGWTDQDETWHAGRPWHWPYCVRWGPRSPSQKGHSPQFSEHICCGQMARWIKMPLGRKVGLDPSDIVLDGDPAPSFAKNGAEPPQFLTHVYCAQMIAHLSYCWALVLQLLWDWQLRIIIIIIQ